LYIFLNVLSGYSMKQQVFYIHGGESYDDHDVFLNRLHTIDIRDLPTVETKGKWTGTLAAELGEDYEVFMPAMPNKQNAKYEEWKIWFERHFEYLNDGVILLGCSLGAMFLTKYLADNTPPFSVKVLMLLACPIRVTGFHDDESGSFRFNTNVIPELAGKAAQIFVLHSKDDFLVPYEHALTFHELLPEAELLTFEDKNHFLVAKFPELIQLIKKIS